MDIRIIDIDISNGIICFLYNGQKAFDQVKLELGRIGHPIQHYTNTFPENKAYPKNSDVNSSASIQRGRRPYYVMGR